MTYDTELKAVQAALQLKDHRRIKFALARLAIARGRSTHFSTKQGVTQ